MDPSRRRRLQWIVHIVLAILGVTAVALLVRHVGVERLGQAMADCGPVLPFVLLLEAARSCADAWRTQLLYSRGGVHVPFRRVLPVQIASYPLSLLVPAGGAASEAYKASILAEDTGGPVAAAAATTNQALQLYAVFIVSIPCGLAAFAAWGFRGFTIAILVQALTAIGLATAIQIATRHRAIGALVSRVSSKAGEHVSAHRTAVTDMSFIPFGPLGAALLSRVAWCAQYGLLIVAAGGAPRFESALLASGVQLVGGAAGDLVPAQIGAMDGAFALAASPLGLAPAAALSIAMAMHVVQLTWAVVGIAMPPPKRPVEPTVTEVTSASASSG
ncbi:MAG: flippase-like domain-containing protein [Polyangiaceae bacterium]|nr:flippase-like domain-containing protein [Polyangiaceae bacterium]